MTDKITEWKNNILSDQQFLELVEIRTGLNKVDCEIALKEFITDKTATLETEDWKKEKDFRRNFLFWIPSYIQRKIKTNGTTKVNGFSESNPFVKNYNSRKEGNG